MPRVSIDRDRCKGCGTCNAACPTQVLGMSEEINTKGYFPAVAVNPDRCTGCALCAMSCPDVAIEVFKEPKGSTEEKLVFTRPESLTDKPTHYCPGCTHGVIHLLVAQVLDELELRERVVGVAPVGCTVLIYNYFNCDFLEAAHGRAPAFATGIKRVSPDTIAFTYQGDGDLASIGTNEILHAANRGEKFTTIFVNNAVYGMTGGQMAPTTMPEQVTTTSPAGRDVENVGYPIRVAELLSTLKTPAYITRTAVDSPKNIIKTKKAIKKAFNYQKNNTCFSLVEVLSICPTNWGKSTDESLKWLREVMIPYYPLGDLKTPEESIPVAAEA